MLLTRPLLIFDMILIINNYRRALYQIKIGSFQFGSARSQSDCGCSGGNCNVVLRSISAFRLVLLHQILRIFAVIGRRIQFSTAQLQLRRRFMRNATRRDYSRNRLRKRTNHFRFRRIMRYFVNSYKLHYILLLFITVVVIPYRLD